MLTHLQDNYGQLMPHELLGHEDTVKKMIYNPRYPILAVFSDIEELLELSDITGTSYTKYQSVSIAYIILHRTGKFGLVIREWNRTTTVQRTWVRFKQFFWTAHQELKETSNLTMEDPDMHHTNMVRNVVAGLQEDLQQEQAPTENAATILEPIDHVENAVQNTQKELFPQLQQMQAVIWAIQMQYYAAPRHAHKDYGG